MYGILTDYSKQKAVKMYMYGWPYVVGIKTAMVYKRNMLPEALSLTDQGHVTLTYDVIQIKVLKLSTCILYPTATLTYREHNIALGVIQDNAICRAQ